MPPARLLITAVRTASARSLSPLRRAARVDQAGAAHVAVGHLVAGQIDRMVARQLGVDLLVRLAVRIVLACSSAL